MGKIISKEKNREKKEVPNMAVYAVPKPHAYVLRKESEQEIRESKSSSQAKAAIRESAKKFKENNLKEKE